MLESTGHHSIDSKRIPPRAVSTPFVLPGKDIVEEPNEFEIDEPNNEIFVNFTPEELMVMDQMSKTIKNDYNEGLTQIMKKQAELNETAVKSISKFELNLHSSQNFVSNLNDSYKNYISAQTARNNLEVINQIYELEPESMTPSNQDIIAKLN